MKKTQATKRPKTLWAILGEANELSTPFKVTWSEIEEAWWDEKGYYCITSIGLDREEKDLFTFSSKNLEEVEAFLKGFNFCADLVLESLFTQEGKAR